MPAVPVAWPAPHRAGDRSPRAQLQGLQLPASFEGWQAPQGRLSTRQLAACCCPGCCSAVAGPPVLLLDAIANQVLTSWQAGSQASGESLAMAESAR